MSLDEIKLLEKFVSVQVSWQVFAPRVRVRTKPLLSDLIALIESAPDYAGRAEEFRERAEAIRERIASDA